MSPSFRNYNTTDAFCPGVKNTSKGKYALISSSSDFKSWCQTPALTCQRLKVLTCPSSSTRVAASKTLRWAPYNPGKYLWNSRFSIAMVTQRTVLVNGGCYASVHGESSHENQRIWDYDFWNDESLRSLTGALIILRRQSDELRSQESSLAITRVGKVSGNSASM